MAAWISRIFRYLRRAAEDGGIEAGRRPGTSLHSSGGRTTPLLDYRTGPEIQRAKALAAAMVWRRAAGIADEARKKGREVVADYRKRVEEAPPEERPAAVRAAEAATLAAAAAAEAAKAIREKARKAAAGMGDDLQEDNIRRGTGLSEREEL